MFCRNCIREILGTNSEYEITCVLKTSFLPCVYMTMLLFIYKKVLFFLWFSHKFILKDTNWHIVKAPFTKRKNKKNKNLNKTWLKGQTLWDGIHTVNRPSTAISVLRSRQKQRNVKVAPVINYSTGQLAAASSTNTNLVWYKRDICKGGNLQWTFLNWI